jgi:hypothetical protein
MAAIYQIKAGIQIAKEYPHTELWPSLYTSVDMIVNRVTPPHRDSAGSAKHYDLLVSAGEHTRASLILREVGASFSYAPGTLVFLCGKVLMHELNEWEGGERICVAHYVHDTVHDHLGLARPEYPLHHLYI